MGEPLWRGSLSERRTVPLGCAAAPLVSAAHSSGSELPRHKGSLPQGVRVGPRRRVPTVIQDWR
ncbi:hypothetical protein EJA72_14215 [Pseudomonas sp. PB120]|nr:hypothetical protein [Pseudomonas sp. PB120]